MVGVVVICAALLALAWGLRRRQRAGAVSLGRGVWIHLVEDGAETVVLGVSPLGVVSHLGTVPSGSALKPVHCRVRHLSAAAVVAEVRLGEWSMFCAVGRNGEVKALRPLAPERRETA